jgi:hypothetical protein
MELSFDTSQVLKTCEVMSKLGMYYNISTQKVHWPHLRFWLLIEF